MPAGLDNAYSCDPRVKRFKEEEKAEKEAKKQAKVEAAKKEASQKKEVSQIFLPAVWLYIVLAFPRRKGRSWKRSVCFVRRKRRRQRYR